MFTCIPNWNTLLTVHSIWLYYSGAHLTQSLWADIYWFPNFCSDERIWTNIPAYTCTFALLITVNHESSISGSKMILMLRLSHSNMPSHTPIFIHSLSIICSSNLYPSTHPSVHLRTALTSSLLQPVIIYLTHPHILPSLQFLLIHHFTQLLDSLK